MKQYYSSYGISKQGHFQALSQAAELDNKRVVYTGFIDRIRVDHPLMGLRAIYQQFKPEGIGRDNFIALGMEEGYRLRVPHNPMITTRSVKSSRFSNLLQEVRVTGVNQVWVGDLFYFPCGDKHFYGVLLMDVYSRRIIGYSMTNNMRGEQTLAALTMALTLRGINDYRGSLIHHSDRGSQYVSNAYTDTLDETGIRISMCTNVLENAHSERANGTIKNQYLIGFDTDTPPLLTKAMDRSVKGYNGRGHRSLQGMTPVEYENHLKSVPEADREIMRIFTMNAAPNSENQSQLSLFSEATLY